MIDSFGRAITYLRLSVTDRCDLRCRYCLGASHHFLPREEILSLEELGRISRAFIRCGVRKIRLTGGEPLTRRNVMSLVADLGGLLAGNGLDELTLTTNGTRLAQHAQDLAAAGVRRVNISLDTLNPAEFARLTGHDRIEQTVDGIMAAKAAGLAIRINAVALRGITEAASGQMVEWCGRHGFDLCFIELMPLGRQSHGQALPLPELRAILQRRWQLEMCDYRSGGPADYVTVAETGGRIGFISPLSSHGFCKSCNRVRLTCAGHLYSCLGHEHTTDLRAILRAGRTDNSLDEAISEAIVRKRLGHDFSTDKFATSRRMNVTGG